MKRETHKAKLARLKAKRDEIKSGVKPHRPTRTPFAWSWARGKK